MRPARRTQPSQPKPTIVALCVALFGISAASAQTYPLPNVGSVNDCASTVRAFAGGHGNQSCAQTQGTVLPQRLKESSFQAKCPVGQPLRGLLNNTCTDKPNVHPPHPMSSNYNTTLCCGYAQPRVQQATTTTPPLPPISSPEYHVKHFKVADVTLRMGASNDIGCPQTGVRYLRSDVPSSVFLRGLEKAINGHCTSRGAPYGFSSIRLHACTATPDPGRAPQMRYLATADIFCAR